LDESLDRRRRTAASDCDEADLARNVRRYDGTTHYTRKDCRVFGQKTDPEPGCYHVQNPILALASIRLYEIDLLLAAQMVERVAVFAIDPGEVKLSVKFCHWHIAFGGKPMACRTCDDEPLGIKFESPKRRLKAVWTGHESDVQLSLDEEIAQLLWNAFQKCDFHARIVRSEAA
jgi:hypothetical protein